MSVRSVVQSNNLLKSRSSQLSSTQTLRRRMPTTISNFNSFNSSNFLNTFNKTFTRSIYLHSGSRIEGLKRDPKEVFKNQKGVQYGANDQTLSSIKSFLGSKYQIPDDVALQIITHKSFGNGMKPYNIKLSVMGSKLLKLYTAKYVIHQQSTTPDKIKIEGKDLTKLGSLYSKELSGRDAAGYFAKVENLNKTMFWVSRDPTASFEASGELKVSGQLVHSLIGAVNFYHGKDVAEEFIGEKIMKGLEEITKQLVTNQ
ncbi:hypothetical protein PVL30_003008 [Lodderomyces elongisporus]|uniref:uncharacterized protein n=1 Tax=Lodderomyces elongisporus TaxID=36914 RepID=UPI00291D93FF|nr:uncharacterized protein PVL30_003008 [Lodderomyces elongisporus]WLF79256.1 hypothetical protein PVL30_003008 [Lodderomyces elongisporus]